MASLAAGLFQALVATFLYAVPAGSVHLMVRGLSDPRLETWDAPEEARLWKLRYRHWSRFALVVNRVLFGLFAVQLLTVLVRVPADCARHASHLTAAAWNLEIITDRAFTLGFALIFLFALAALVWSGTYFFRARQSGWGDPRRKDPLIVHIIVVPLALLLMWIAFGIAPRMICG